MRVATPSRIEPGPSAVDPLQNWTDPAGGGPCGARVNVAVQVTGAPDPTGSGDPEIEIVDGARAGVMLTVFEVRATHPGVPVKRAVRGCTERPKARSRVATPSSPTATVPSTAPSSEKVTVPVG